MHMRREKIDDDADDVVEGWPVYKPYFSILHESRGYDFVLLRE